MVKIDPRLARHLRDASEKMSVDAIVIIADHKIDALNHRDDNGLAEHVIQQTIQLTNEEPTFVRFIPRANAVAVTAHTPFIYALLGSPHVQIASSATIDPFYIC